MLSSVVVVVILGAVIAAVAYAVLAEGTKPATVVAAPGDAPPPDTPSPSEAHEDPLADALPAEPAWHDEPVASAEPARARSWRPTRAVILLSVTICVLGAAAAALLAALVVVGASLIDQALG